MPDYTEAAIKDGWEQVGTKWKNDKHPGVIRYSPKQIWDEDLPANLKRPNSASDPLPPPKAPESPHVAPVVAEVPKPVEPKPEVRRKPGRPFKRDREGYIVPKDE